MPPRKPKKRNYRMIAFKVYYDSDQDILDWWEDIEAGERSDAVRDLIREQLGAGRRKPSKAPIIDLPELLERGIDVAEYPVRSFFRPHFAWQQARLYARLRRERIQVVHSYNFYANVFATLAARAAGVPLVIASIRDRGAYLTPLQRQVQRHACSFADLVLVNAESVREWLLGLARFGLSARALVFFIVGGFLISAGLKASSAETKTTGDALRVIAHQTYGTFLLTIVALGLVAYGAYMLASARYHRFAI